MDKKTILDRVKSLRGSKSSDSLLSKPIKSSTGDFSSIPAKSNSDPNRNYKKRAQSVHVVSHSASREGSSSSLEYVGECYVESLPDVILIGIFSFLTPENLYSVALVNKKWSIISSDDKVWKQFCCTYWDQKPPITQMLDNEDKSVIASKKEEENKSLTWKKVYLLWLRRNADRLKEIQIHNQRMFDKYTEGKISNYYPISFFWPSYTALKERSTYKILILGESGVGKRSLLKRFVENKVSKPRSNHGFHISRLSKDVVIRTIDIYGRVLELQLLESGSDTFKKSPTSCFLHAHACFVCFDITNSYSFECARNFWFLKIKKHNPSALVYLIGTKSDLESKRQVTKEIATEISNMKCIKYFEISSKMNLNIDDIFYSCSTSLFKSLAWPNYVPPESMFRYKVGLPDNSDWVVKDENGIKGSVGTSGKCVIQ